MARARKEEAEEVDDEEEDEVGIDRDFAMARLAAARAAAQGAVAMIDDAINWFVDPSDDKKGKDRQGALDSALDELGVASRGVEAAKEVLDEMEAPDLERSEEDALDEDD